MKRRSLILVGFLVVLFIVPMISTSSYDSFTIPTQPNSNKDFSLSETYEYSPDSVPLFDETTEDNEMFYPDGFYDSTPVFAYDGIDDFHDTWIIDGSSWSNLYGQDVEYALFETDYAIEGFEYSIYGFSHTGYVAGMISWFNGTIMQNLTSVAFGNVTNMQWHNGSINQPNYSVDIFVLQLQAGHIEFSYTSIDYIEIRFQYIFGSVTDEGPAYADSFYNVSEWVFDVATGTYSFTSDGDIGTLAGECVGIGNDYVRYEQYGLSIPKESYVEFRYKTVDAKLRIQFFDGDIEEPAPCYEIYSTDYTTVKFYLETYVDNDVTGIEIQINDLSNTKATGNIYAYFDYIRIGPSNEMGFQHDGSTVEGFTEIGADGWTTEFSSDGDILSVNLDRSGGTGTYGRFIIYYDTTATSIDIDPSYYPFAEIKYRTTSFIGATNFRMLPYVDGKKPIDTTEGLIYDTVQVSEWAYNTINIAAMTGTTTSALIDCYVYGGDGADITIEIDYVKFYSIADFSYVAGGGESVDDYSYAEDGKLIVHTDTYTKWNYDPILSTTIATYPLWNATIEGDDSGFRFRELLDTNTLWDQGIITGELVGTTLEDFDLLIYSNCNISAINFYGQVPAWVEVTNVDFVFFVSGWHIISSVIIRFATEINPYTINLLLIFLGLALIPTSAFFAVKGGRSEMGKDKLFYVLIAFALGWALFLGGIFG